MRVEDTSSVGEGSVYGWFREAASPVIFKKRATLSDRRPSLSID
jgi:hypothetical protein